MAEFPANSKRIDPYRNWRFQVWWDGKPVAAVSKVTGLDRTTLGPHHAPGQTTYGAITLERGVTHDVAFEQWANKVWYYPNTTKLGQEVSLEDFRKDLQIVLFDEKGQRVLGYDVYRCWPSEFEAMAELDGTSSAVLIQRLTLQNEGWSEM